MHLPIVRSMCHRNVRHWRRIARACALVVVVLCSRSSVANDQRVSPTATAVYRGHYTHGFEVSSFVRCGNPEAWWTGGSVAQLIKAAREAGADARTIYVELEGRLSSKGRYGHLGA